MTFGTFLDPDGDFLDTTHFPQSLKAWPLTGGGIYLLEGIVVSEFGFCSLEIERCARLPILTPNEASTEDIARLENVRGMGRMEPNAKTEMSLLEANV
jgi:hypothetical protein